MSRSGYTDDSDNQWASICWRGAVASAIRGKRGQAFLKELLDALDTMPQKRLIPHDLIKEGEVCALGSVGVRRGIDMSTIDVEDYGAVSKAFGVTQALAREIEYENDEGLWYSDSTPEKRWQHMRNWVAEQIKDKP